MGPTLKELGVIVKGVSKEVKKSEEQWEDWATALKRISENELFKLEQKIEDVDEAIEHTEAPVIALSKELSKGLYDAMVLVAVTGGELEEAMEAVRKETTDLDNAFQALGVTSDETAEQELAKLRQAVEVVTVALQDGRASTEDLERAQEAYARALDGPQGAIDATEGWAGVMKQVSTIVTDMNKQIVDAFTSGGSITSAFVTAFKAMGKAVLRFISEQIMGALFKSIGKLLGLAGKFKGGGGLLGMLFGGGGGKGGGLFGGLLGGGKGGGLFGGLLGGGKGGGLLGGLASLLGIGGGGAGAGGALAGTAPALAPFLFGTPAALAAPTGLAAGGTAAAGSGGMMASLIPLMTNPITIAIAGAIAAGFATWKIFRHTPTGAGSKEIARDFGGVNVSKPDVGIIYWWQLGYHA